MELRELRNNFPFLNKRRQKYYLNLLNLSKEPEAKRLLKDIKDYERCKRMQ